MRKSPILAWLFIVMSVFSWMALSPSPTLAKTEIAGYEWSQSLHATSGRWSVMASSGDGSIAIAGYDLALSKVRITRDGGATWAELGSSPSASWNDLAMSDDGSVMVLAGSDAPSSSIWVSTNGGTSFTLAATASPMAYERLAISANGARILVVSDGGVLLSTDSGSTFSAVSDLAGLTQGDVAMTSDGMTMYASYFGSGVMRSVDGGTTWTTLTSAGTGTWTSFDVSGDGKTLLGVISYNGRGVRVSSDSGVTFTEPADVGATFESQLAQGAVSRDGSVLIAASYGSEPMMSADNGDTWVSSTAGKRGWIRFAVSNDGSRIYGAVENSGVWRRTPIPPPTITGLSVPPASVGGRTIDIYGTNFVDVTSVTVDGTIQAFTVPSRTSIRITPGALTKSEVVITVTTASGSASTSTSVVAPTITKVEPNSGPQTGGVTGGYTTVRVFGNFFGVTITSATIGGNSATVISTGDAMVDLTVPPGAPGVVDVVLETSIGQLRSTRSFTYYTLPLPTVSATTPASVSWAGGSTVTVTGSGIGDATDVKIAGKPAIIVERNGRDEIRIQTPPALVGLHDITVTNPIGTRTTPKALRYTWQSIGAKAAWAGFGGVATNGALNGSPFATVTMPNGDVILGGAFSDVANIPEADAIVRWNGSSWSALGSNGSGDGALNGIVRSLAVDNDGSLIAVGDFRLPDDSRGIARFSNGTWTSVGGGLGADGRAIALSSDGTLYVGGLFQNVGDQPTADYLVRLDRVTDTWKSLGSNGSGNGALNGIVRSLATTSDGIIAGGHFTNAAGLPEADYIARWNGTSWSALSSNGSGNGALPSGFVTTSIDIREVDGAEVILVGTCRNGGSDGSAHFYKNGQWREVTEIRLDSCVRDVALLPDGRAVLAGWFNEILSGGNGTGLIVGSDSLGWESLGDRLSYVETIQIDHARHRMILGAYIDNINNDPLADFVAMTDTAFLDRTPLSVNDPGLLETTSRGGSLVRLTGSGFGATTNVTVGDIPVQTITVDSPTRISFVVPSGLSTWSTLSVYNNRNLVSFPRAILNSSPPKIRAPSVTRITKTPFTKFGRIPDTLYAGSKLSATFRGFTPDAWVYAYVASTPVLVGAALADSKGVVRMTFTIPEIAGTHSLVLYEPTGNKIRRQAVTIVKQELPATGADLGVLPLALHLLILGFLLLLRPRGVEGQRMSGR